MARIGLPEQYRSLPIMNYLKTRVSVPDSQLHYSYFMILSIATVHGIPPSQVKHESSIPVLVQVPVIRDILRT